MSVTTLWGDDDARTADLLDQAPDVRASDSPGELIGSVDAVIVGDRHGDQHLPHVMPCIAAGKPVFVDKPLACSLADATAIVDAAERAGTPLLSGSALRWQQHSVLLKSRLSYLEGHYSVHGYGTWYPDSEYGGAI